MNAITAIFPYKHHGLWVFDDARTGLEQEPFVAGADTLIDRALVRKGIQGDHGFRLLFSAGEFPGCDLELRWVREGDGGNWYHADDFDHDAWLCPALLKYFDSAPTRLYVKLEGLTADGA